jgi:hypothetical protein
VACCGLAGCRARQPLVGRDALVGNYAYVSKDPENRVKDHNFDHLVLRTDGTYDLVEGGTTKAVSRKKGTWRIEKGEPAGVSNVVLDNAGYPIETKGGEERLLIDLDTGIWWVKTK